MRRFFVFDLGETLINFNLHGKWRESLSKDVIPLMYNNLKQLIPNHDTLPSFETFSDIVYKVISREPNPVSGSLHKDVSMVKRINYYLDHFQLPCSDIFVKSQTRAFSDIMKNHLELYDDVISTLNLLKEQGITLGLWSNSPWHSPGYIFEEFLDNYKIKDYFITRHYSGDYEIGKPDPKILEIVRTSTNFSKDDMIYIGNSEVDIKVGVNYGIPTILVKREGFELSQECPKPSFTLSNIKEILDLLPIK